MSWPLMASRIFSSRGTASATNRSTSSATGSGSPGSRNSRNPCKTAWSMGGGKAAGAGVHDHFHLHVVPRWEGDANFMAVAGDTRVLSFDMDTVRRIIADAYAEQRKTVTAAAGEKPPS